MMKIVVLTSPTVPNVYLVNYLSERHNVVARLVENRFRPSTTRQKMEIRRRLVRKHGLLRTANKLLYNKYRSLFIDGQRKKVLREMLFPDGREAAYSTEVPTLEVGSVNCAKSIDFISGHAPDVIAVCGTGLIKPEVFELPGRGTINIHCGITPEYRSADPIFWALYNNEPDMVGVTIHYVDRGVDTGPIIRQEKVGVAGGDDLATLYAKCIKCGAGLMSAALTDIENGSVGTIRKEGSESRAYYHMDLGILEYAVCMMRMRKLKRRLQNQKDAQK